MAGHFGDSIAKTVAQGDVTVVATSWMPLTSSGTSGVTTGTLPLSSRRQVRYQLKSNPGGAIAIQYAQKNADGTFTTPTTSVKLCTIYPGNSTIVEPLGDSVQLFAKLVKKKGFTSDSIRVIVTEYA